MKKLFLLAVFLFTACGALPIDEEAPLPMFEPPADVVFNTIPVQRGDVVSDAVLLPIFNSEIRYILNFARAGLEIEEIHVSNGDVVTQGQVIASLKDPENQEDIEEVRRDRERLALQIRQLQERHEFSLRMAETTGVPLDDYFYLSERERLDTAMYFLILDYEALISAELDRFVFSPIDGVVRNVMGFIEGQLSSVSATVAIVEDMEQAFFRAQRHTVAAYISPGDRFTMTIVPMALAVEVEAIIPDGFDPHPTTAWFNIIGGEDLVFESGTLGRIVHVFDMVSDVIAIPSRALRRDGDRHFVFVLEDDIRRRRHVEIGIQSTQYTQILSGLETGELIIL
ncbi:MAG: efflux RND transporter periplasmic adaptor subunit [Defluviitaleaceae bacterium]|nr:efflux RND transporter periplasmic adaptor subunit [Defluviitaleaceae bacterium]